MSKPRHTLWYLITALSVGGAEKTLVRLANDLDHETFDVTIWTIFDQNPLAANLVDEVTLRTLGVEGITPDEGNHYVTGASNSLDYVRAPVRFFRAVRREEPDLVQSFLFYDNVMARFAGLVSPETVVITGVRSVPNETRWSVETVERTTIRLSDAIISNSEAGARLARARGANPGDVTVIQNGREIDVFREADQGFFREEFGIAPDAPVFGTVGRLIERKGHHDLVAAMPTILDRYPAAALVLVGEGPEREALRHRASELNCEDSVHFAGVRDDIPRILSTFDVFVFPSYFEGLPGALIEAMASGLPIVTTPVDGNRELVENYRHGVYVSPGEPSEIAWAGIRLLDNPELASSLGTAAQRRAQNKYTTDRMVQSISNLYRCLTENEVES
ncbi:glycosyltransferase (plasmid) [Halorussus limi]|uniref:Glycosyltransferase n=1 Tax=Halorussus limi TaxID=2938695 RepID=A0A8U0I0D0_9EURY|nr:glycosyltransferase [Halorussus limi]UPV76637.1 glycosyltransferase [Halorussus limi]